MLQYQKDGKIMECKRIWGNGYVGQVVIHESVSFGENPDLTKYPQAKYLLPYAFTIVEKTEGKDEYYKLADAEGNIITLQDEHLGASGGYLHDANEWIAWQEGRNKEMMARKNRKIEQLEGHLALLKDVLTKQGIRVITEEAAKKLGIVP